MAGKTFEVAVVGRGMMGSACAWFLAEAGVNVLLVGQSEPADRKKHDGVFASHHDDTRIARIVDPNPVKAWLSHRALPQIRHLENLTGEKILHDVGHLWLGPAEEVAVMAASDQNLNVGCQQFSPEEVGQEFTALSPPADLPGIFQATGAGHIDPRAYVRAEGAAAEQAGTSVVDALVGAVKEQNGNVTLETSAGEFAAQRVVLATGPFFAYGDTPANQLDLTVGTRTIIHFELPAEEAQRLAGLPSIIVKTEDKDRSFYVLPPKPQPDGRTIMKVGITRERKHLTPSQIADWFRSDGDLAMEPHQKQLLFDFIPNLKVLGSRTAPCVTTYTETGHPIIDNLTDRVSALIAGNGYAAKCASALGELAANRLLGKPWPTEINQQLFQRP